MTRGRGVLVARSACVTPVRGVLVALTACVLLAGACSGDGSGGGDPAVRDSATGPTPSAARPSPRPVPTSQRFALDDTAKYSDGLQVEIAGTVADTAKSTDRGAEGTGGQIVVASVRMENDTGDPYDATEVLITASYGGVDAPIVVDPSGELTSGFKGTIAKGDEAVAVVGFAIPISGLKRVTFVVDPNDDVHQPVSFTGEVEQT